MIKRTLVLAAAGALALAGCGTSDANNHDIKGIPGTPPDSVTIYTNVDGHPNLGRICIMGIAFVTAQRDAQPYNRLPEWDWTCPKPPGFQPYKGQPTNLAPARVTIVQQSG